MLLPRVTFVPNSGDAKPANREDRRNSEQRLLTFWTNVSLVTAVAAGLIIAWAHGSVVSASIAAFGGALGLGGVLGFLFGVPSPKQTTTAAATLPTHIPPPAPAPAGQAQALLVPIAVVPLVQPQDHQAGIPANPAPAHVPSSAAAGPTSNLEQVADWVTKLLLGGGLTQISKIPPKIWQWSHAVAVGILGDDTNPAHIPATQAFAAGLLVYGFVLGFFAGFLITKLQLGKAISNC